MRRLSALLVGALAGACASKSGELPPYGEALIVVDTDLPVPSLVNRLRFDLYSEDGSKWLASRDVALRDQRDWPTSFSVYTADAVRERVVLVRLRAYFEGRVRDYHGERFIARPPAGALDELAVPASGCEKPADCELPRLVEGGIDTTPTSEPQPLFAVDRLLQLQLVPGVRGRAHVVLRGMCLGVMADVAGARSCVDADGVLAPLGAVALEPSMTIPAATEKTFGAPLPCPATAAPRPGRTRPGGAKMFDEEVCVPGGMFAFGDRDGRFAIVPPFYMDKYEVTVARWREFTPPSPTLVPKSNAAKLERDTCKVQRGNSELWCSYSAAAGVPEDRESHAVTCLSWQAARAFCQSQGGDLPTEAQWEWVTHHAGRPARTEYPWSDAPPTCLTPKGGVDQVVVSRLDSCSIQDFYFDTCVPGAGKGCGKLLAVCGTTTVINPRQGPQPVNEVDRSGGDWSAGLGIVGLFGGVAEYTRDRYTSLRSKCWATTTLVSPACLDDAAADHTVRGASWVGGALGRAIVNNTLASAYAAPSVGFRCVRPVEAK